MRSLILTLLLLTALSASAQKLPKKQEAGVWAPTVIKIDGKTDEWNNQFAAYNPLDRIYYTLANNHDNLYLVIATDNTFFQEKAVYGITLTINLQTENGKKSKENVKVLFPAEIEGKNINIINNTASTVRHILKDTSAKAKRKVDSLILFANTTIDNCFKEIEIDGLKEANANHISVYNELGIKASARFNNDMQYVYELAIPLKYFGSAINRYDKLTYNIKLNGPPEVYSSGMSSVRFDNPGQTLTPDALYQNYATDFSGEYTLVKAP